MLEYYSTDKAGNKEAPHSAVRGIASPSLSDLADSINNSGIDNAGIKNALLGKVAAAEAEQSRGGPLNILNVLLNQLNALEGKHGLSSSTVANIEAMVQAILAESAPPAMLSPVDLPLGGASTLQLFGLGLFLFTIASVVPSAASSIFVCRRILENFRGISRAFYIAGYLF
jgi:hypothetical protein